MVLWKSENHGKDLEAVVLGHSLSGICGIQNISFYSCFQLSVALFIISFIFVLIFIIIESI